MSESQFIEDGRSLGYSGATLQKYVTDRVRREEERSAKEEERCAKEERRRQEDLERESRLQSREEKKREHELKMAELELEKLRLEASAPQSSSMSSSTKSLIKPNPFKEGEDVAVYLRTFDKVKEANNWPEHIAIPALMNGFTNTKVGLFLDTLPADLTYVEVKDLII